MARRFCEWSIPRFCKFKMARRFCEWSNFFFWSLKMARQLRPAPFFLHSCECSTTALGRRAIIRRIRLQFLPRRFRARHLTSRNYGNEPPTIRARHLTPRNHENEPATAPDAGNITLARRAGQIKPLFLTSRHRAPFRQIK